MAKFRKKIRMDANAGLPTIGIHRARCVDAEMQEIKKGPNRGEDMLVLDFEVLTKGETGRKAKMWLPLLEQTEWKYSKVFVAFGIEANSKNDADISDKDFIGKTVRISIDHRETDSGDMMPDVQNVLPDSDGAVSTSAASHKVAPSKAAGNDDDDDGLPPEEDLPF